MGSGGVTALATYHWFTEDVNRSFLLHNDFAHLGKSLSARCCRTYKWYTHARVVVVVTPILPNKIHVAHLSAQGGKKINKYKKNPHTAATLKLNMEVRGYVATKCACCCCL